MGFQDLARNWRRKESLKLADKICSLNSQQVNKVYIATAHQQEDQVETILMKLLRGVHLSKLQQVIYKQYIIHIIHNRYHIIHIPYDTMYQIIHVILYTLHKSYHASYKIHNTYIT